MLNHTPLPNKENTEPEPLDFFKALRQVAKGKTITKREWKNKDIHCLLMNGRLMVKNGTFADGLYHDWVISAGDMAGDDWEVL